MTTTLSRRSRNSNGTIHSLLQSQSFKKVLRPVIAALIFLVVWQLAVWLQGSGASLPGPIQVIAETWDPLIINPFYDEGDTAKGLALQIFASLKRVAVGYGLAAVVGIAIGLLIGTSPVLYDAVDPLFQVLRPIPPLAWLPISLAAFRVNEPSAIFVIFITAIWPILLNTTVGVKQVPQDYLNVARVLRLSRQEYFLKIVVPAAVPYIFTGLRIGIGLAWLAIIAAEMLVGGVGIGFFIWDSYNANNISAIILALFYIGIVGLLLDRLVAFIATKLVVEEQRQA